MAESLSLVGPALTDLATDDSAFVQIVRRAVSGELESKSVHGLFLIRIDNWFDHKWLNFSGKGRVAFGQYTGLAYNPDTALDEFHRQGAQSTFPPFTPNRVVSQDFYRGDDGVYTLDEDGPWIHAASLESSSANLHRRIVANNSSCLFVWFSSNALKNGRGSLMVYRANGTAITSWYASYSRDPVWRLVQNKGISLPLLRRLGIA